MKWLSKHHASVKLKSLILPLVIYQHDYLREAYNYKLHNVLDQTRGRYDEDNNDLYYEEWIDESGEVQIRDDIEQWEEERSNSIDGNLMFIFHPDDIDNGNCDFVVTTLKNENIDIIYNTTNNYYGS